MSLKFDAKYWNDRYLDGSHPWDLGHPSQPLQKYFEQLSNKALKILIPGAGNGYEAAWLWEQGFEQVHVVDWSEQALINFQANFPDFPKENLICEDFFKFTGSYDLIIEQTFFCALPPKLRPNYVSHMHAIMAPEAKLVGLFFEFPMRLELGPPWGGHRDGYRALFQEYFDLSHLEPCHNSEPERMGKELFFIFRKK